MLSARSIGRFGAHAGSIDTAGAGCNARAGDGWAEEADEVVLDARVSPRLSIVAPCYNEEAGLGEFYRRMTAAAQATAGSDYEFVLLNDGSSDRTWAIM